MTNHDPEIAPEDMDPEDLAESDPEAFAALYPDEAAEMLGRGYSDE